MFHFLGERLLAYLDVLSLYDHDRDYPYYLVPPTFSYTSLSKEYAAKSPAMTEKAPRKTVPLIGSISLR